ncbi:MAG TPA: hypothetical protein VGG48_01655 [Rhizomicrobium sp.]|jgi:hypothetical protein
MLALVAAALIASAPVTVSERPDAVSLTLYHTEGIETSDLMAASEYMRREGLAFVTETRTVDLPAGPSVIRLRGVVSTMVPQTAILQGLPGGAAETNFDYDLLSPGALLAKSVGQTVRLVRTDPKTGKRTEETAIVRSAPNGTVLDVGGRVEALGCSGLPEKIVFDSVPEGLADTPTLSVNTSAPVAGRYTIKLSYIATGLNWNADYVAHVAPNGKTLDLSGWITLANFSATGFGTIPVDIVAGKLNTTGEDEPLNIYAKQLSRQCWPTNINWGTARMMTAVGQQEYKLMAPPPPPPPPQSMADASTETVVVTGSRIPDPRALGDYKLYTLPEPTLMAAQQTKQIQFLDQRDVKFDKIYGYRIDLWDHDERIDPARVLFRLKNKKDDGLGKPLPAGQVSVMEIAGSGTMVFAGRDAIKDTAVDSPLEVGTGAAQDISVDRQVKDLHAVGEGKDKREQRTFEATVTNDKSVPIRFEFQLPVYEGLRILTESAPHGLDRGNMVWQFALKPGESATLTYDAEVPE